MYVRKQNILSVIVECIYMALFRFEELKPSEQERMENKGWLNDHLTAVASLCYGDLKAMKDTGHRCFPESYDIVKFFITHYHHHLVDVVCKFFVFLHLAA